jgi:hypothetical protein
VSLPRVGNVISFASLQGCGVTVSQSVSQSVRLGFEPLIGTHGHILAFKEYSGIVCCGASTQTGGRVCHVKGSQCLCRMYVHTLFLM